jgi:mannose-6-phosphate isomerase-like protein (cupin superfamily)
MNSSDNSEIIKASAVSGTNGSRSIASAVLLSSENVDAIQNCLGVAVIHPGEPATPEMVHKTSEVMYVSRGQGRLESGSESHEFSEGDALYIPAGKAHSLVNTGSTPLVSVYSFPLPYRPPTSVAEGSRA